MLYIVATPIGNLDDMTKRAVDALRQAQVIACEDTRRTRILLNHFEIPIPESMISYRQGNEERTGEYIVRLIGEGKTVALCTDGGYPGISDPGYRLVKLAVEKGITFHVIPGASAIPMALVSSGLSTSSYVFKGYPQRKPGALSRFFTDEKDKPHTIVFFESPYRVGKTLAAAFKALGDRQAAVCCELTKLHERVSRGFLSDLVKEYAGKTVKGEVTIVIAGNNPKFSRGDGTTPPDGQIEELEEEEEEFGEEPGVEEEANDVEET